MEPRRRGYQWAVPVLVVLALVASACSGGDSSPEPTPDSGGDAGDGTEAVAAILEIVDPTGESLLPCGETSDLAAVVAYVDTSDRRPGRNAERMAALIGDYNRRCGSAIEVDEYTSDAVGGDCQVIADTDPTVVIITAATPEDLACFAEAGVALWSEAGVPTSTMVGDATVLSTDLPTDRAAAAAVALMAAEGLLEARTASVLHSTEAHATAVAEDGYLAAFASHDTEATAFEVDDCSEVDAAAWEAQIVVTIVAAECQRELAEAAISAGAEPLWVVSDLFSTLVDDSDVDFTQVAPVFDVALAYSAAPATGGGWPLVLDPHARDAACNTFLDSLLGTTTTYPSVDFSEGARLCTTAAALVGIVGPDAIGDSLASAEAVNYPRGQAGRLTPEAPWVGPDQLFALEWSADCTCWTQVGGPLVASP